MAQEQLRDVWLQAQLGRLCAWEQAKALALREASRELHGRTQLEWIAARVEKTGGGHPNAGALHKFFKMVDADKEWFPGKQKGARRGAKPLMTRAKRRCIARSAMAAKKSRGDEPCVAAVVHACPRATSGTIPESSEAVGEARWAVLSLLTSPRRNARNHRGTIPKP